MPASAAQHHGLGVALRAALDKLAAGDKPLSRPLQPAVQSNMVYQPREVVLVSISMAARWINANR